MKKLIKVIFVEVLLKIIPIVVGILWASHYISKRKQKSSNKIVDV